MYVVLEGVVDKWIAYSYSLYFSDQFSCIKFLNPSYGLKVIEFQSLNHFNDFLNFFYYLLNIIQNIIHNIIQNSADMWDPHVSLCLFIKPLIKLENIPRPTCQ